MTSIFAVHDIETIGDSLQAVDLRVAQEIERRPWGARTALYEDADGNRIWLSEEQPTND